MSRRTKKRYRVKAKCDNCGRVWTTRAKKDPSAPAQCRGKNGCGSRRTRRIKAYRVYI